jgi:hypothetical protein
MKFEGQLAGREYSSRAPRIDVGFDVLVHCAAGDFRAQMTNLSGSGFRLHCSRALEPGWELTLKVGKLAPVKGLVCWAEGRDAGGVFTDPVAL